MKLTLAKKISALVVGLLAIGAVIAAVGIYGIDEITKQTRRVDASGGEALSAARINQSIITLNRAEYRIAADPTPEIIESAKTAIEEERADFSRRYDRIMQTANATQAELLESIKANYELYLEELEQTVALAEELSGRVQISGAQERLVDAARTSRAAAEQVEAAVRDYSVNADRRAETLAAEAVEIGETLSTLMIAIAVGGLVIGGAGGFLLGRNGISLPIRGSVHALRRLADGDTDLEIEGTYRSDEIGSIARAMEVFRDGLIERRRLEAEAEQAEQREEERRKAEMAALADSIEDRVARITREVGKASTELKAAATQMSAAVEETSSQSTAVAAASEQASANVQTVATASEELSAAIAEVASQVADTSSRVNKVSTNAGQAQAELGTLTDAVATVNAVIDDINDVAEQTNLLALNATIEAARAGDAGKGFAVVASEVKNLAQQTQTLTDSVAERITAVDQSANHVVEVLQRLVKEIAEIDEAATAMAGSVDQQSAATQEISRNAAEAATGTSEVSSNITGVQSAATQTSQATGIVSASADTLETNMQSLETAVDGVVSELRAA